jgi:amino acid transporter
VLSLTSIGTLFAFVLVCGGVLVLQQKKDRPESKFKVPYVNGQFIYPIMFIVAIILIVKNVPSHFREDIWTKETWPMAVFWIIAFIMGVLSFMKKLNLLPVLGMVSCFYLMAQETHTVWMRFLIWLVVGLFIYFIYSYTHSKLAKSEHTANQT